MTDYFFYNTDAGSLIAAPRPRYHVLITGGFAATGGKRRFGDQLGQLLPGDTLLMYENMVGIVATGTVRERWDGHSHGDMHYYKHGENCRDNFGREREYRIPVNWHRLQCPISVHEVRRRFGYTPRGTLRKILKRRAEAERITTES